MNIKWVLESLKKDSKTIWTIIFLMGTTLGYSVPENFNNVLPISIEKFEQLEIKVQDLDLRMQALEDTNANFEPIINDKIVRPRFK